jgi:hypothetical protein
MCGAEDGTLGADTIQIPGIASHVRSVQRETEADGRRPVDQDWETSAGGYKYSYSVAVGHFLFH